MSSRIMALNFLKDYRKRSNLNSLLSYNKCLTGWTDMTIDRITEKLHSRHKKNYVRHGTGEGVIYRMHNSDPINKIL